MAIKMRINTNNSSVCQNCNTPYKYTKEMYDVFIIDTKFSLCYDCMDELFHKTLKATCLYNSKLKTQEDQRRLSASQSYKNKDLIKEAEEKPGCFGMFKKKMVCKECKYLEECKTIWKNSGWDD